MTWLRDTFPVYLTDTTDTAIAQQPTRADDEAAERFVCPVTHLPATRYPFVAISSCGHVFSDRAMKQMNDASCATCGRSFKEADLIPINGTPEQVAALKAALPSRHRKSKTGSQKKRKRNDAATDPT